MKKFLIALVLIALPGLVWAQPSGYGSSQGPQYTWPKDQAVRSIMGPTPPWATLPSLTSTNAWTGTNSFLDNKFSLIDEGDPSRILTFQLSGLTTARTLTVPNLAGTLALVNTTNSFTSATYFQSVATAPSFLILKVTDTDGTALDANLTGASLTFTSSGLQFRVSKSFFSDQEIGGTRAGWYDTDAGYPRMGMWTAYAEPASMQFDYLIEGGYTLDGDPYEGENTPDVIRVVTADPGGGSGVTDYKVQVCGYRDIQDVYIVRTFCETLDGATPPETLTTTQAFRQITVIKTSGFVGAISDETVSVAWDSSLTSIRSSTLMVEHPASDFTLGGSLGPVDMSRANFWTPTCVDLQGCTVLVSTPGGFGGAPLHIVGGVGTEDITFVDDATQQLKGGASFVMGEYDTLVMISSYKNSAWSEISRSDN